MKSKKKASKKNGRHQNPVAEGLVRLLADTYVLYVKTQNFHWNVVGPHFFAYHKAFEEQYEQLADAVDVIAERIRALNEQTPASMSDFLSLTSLDEAEERLEVKEMVKMLLEDHEMIADILTELFEIAEENNDEVTLDLLIQRKTEHDKTAWMLRSALGQS